MPTQQQLDSFYQFASSQMENGGVELSMDELLCLWREKNPTPAEVASTVAAVRAAYAEMEAGDSGRPARVALVRGPAQDFVAAMEIRNPD